MLLKRHNAVSTSVLGENAPCAVVFTYNNGYRGEREPQSVRRLGPRVVRGWEAEYTADECFNDYLEGAVFAVASCIWRRGQFDDVIWDVAEDHTDTLLVVALKSGRIYAPYDGGADLFLESKAARDTLQREFAEWVPGRGPSEWIPRREDGL